MTKVNMINNGNKITLIVALLCVSLVHAGVYMGLTAAGSSQQIVMQEGDASMLTMHNVQLAGIIDEAEGNAEDSAVEAEAVESEVVEEVIEEVNNEATPEPEVIPEPEVVPEPKVEPEPVVTPEPIKEAPPVIATNERSETKAAKVVENRPKQAPKKAAPKAVKKPQKAAESVRSVQSAKAVYSESEVNVLSKPTPNYPRAARQRKMQGQVDLIVSINSDGAAQNVRVARSSGHDLLDKAAVKAAQGIRLKPYRINGVATPIQVKIQYLFKM
ncbi:hypothetical protein GCM10007161_14250 [Ignatzschineria indica]|uniref:Protein TonB n=1 Tax=Ignatzschineria indica TaxID=472583 RepID=A0A2U2AIG4_9GAMM|nr:energy transducer TonB [Ignatzschineria indica]PWD82420.1 hypothetical protein DC082_09080 [Ignatzschineria indica]GGZ83734.1 hypothetical protein GCM10007161_14250 [Ignatzschineria indica]